jgi:hypothetical protein
MSTTSTKNSSQTSAPWEVQQPYLQQAFQQANSTQANANANTYTGQQVAQFTPDQLSTFQKMIGYGGNTAGADTSTTVGTNTANAGYGALTGALSNLAGFKPSGSTQSNIDAATAYANNPATDGMIDAAMRDARRSVSEDVLPQLARTEANTGNTMSSKNAIRQGVVERGLADATADTSANIRGQQFQTGLQLANQQSQANDNALLDAFKSSASAGGSAIGTGINGIGSGISQMGGLFDIANAGGAGQQASNQAAIDNSKGMSEYANNNAWSNLQNFYNIIGGQNWGGTKTGTEESTPSMWSTIGSALGMGSSLLKLSDRRMKSDIVMIGHASNGLPVYSYRYTHDPKRLVEVGFMAQDVEKYRPEAVVEIGGLKHVDYELASQ